MKTVIRQPSPRLLPQFNPVALASDCPSKEPGDVTLAQNDNGVLNIHNN